MEEGSLNFRGRSVTVSVRMPEISDMYGWQDGFLLMDESLRLLGILEAECWDYFFLFLV